mmetsp:Transcript_41663/g.70815  ORF Transcript_41663/g.70815 Transcript_41663/m.70815 type:complete len:447 (+) Transcript_41663:542-1882(+)
MATGVAHKGENNEAMGSSSIVGTSPPPPPSSASSRGGSGVEGADAPEGDHDNNDAKKERRAPSPQPLANASPPLSQLTSLYGLLQKALISHENSAKPAASLFFPSTSNRRGGDSSPDPNGLTLAYGESLRRYEVLAQLGEPQAQLNTAFLLHRLASSSPSCSSSSSPISSLTTTVLPWLYSFCSATPWSAFVGAVAGPFMRAYAVLFNTFGGGDGVGLVPGGEGPTTPVCSARQRVLLARSRQYYEMAAAQGVAEAKRELGYCHWGVASWHGACDDSAKGNAQQSAPLTSGANLGGDDGSRAVALSPKRRLKGANLFAEAALQAGGGDLHAYRALAFIHATAGSEDEAALLPRLPTDAHDFLFEGVGGRGEMGVGEASAGTLSRVKAGEGSGGRPEARRLYAVCAELGGYPYGLPCAVEAYGMELVWLTGDVCMVARAVGSWLSGT